MINNAARDTCARSGLFSLISECESRIARSIHLEIDLRFTVIVVIIVDASLLFSSAFFPRNFYPQLAMFAHERATSHDNDILLCSPRLAILPAECQSRPHHPLVRRATREREREREAYENVTPSSLSSPCRYSDVVSHFSSSLCLATRVYFQAQPHRAGDATRKREDDRRERSLSLACAGRSNRWNALTCGLPRCVNHS